MKKLWIITLAIIAVSLSRAQEHYEWGSLPVGGGGFVSGIVTTEADDTLMYARTDVGGAYRWIHSAQTWRPITDWIGEANCGLMGIESLAIDPQHPNRVYLYAGTSYFSNGLSAILVSDDYGETFRTCTDVTSLFPAHGNDGGRQSGERLAVSPTDSALLLCGSRTRGLWRSKDCGRTWERVGVDIFPNDRKVAFVQFLPHKRGENPPILVGMLHKGEANLFRSDDGGTTWVAVGGARSDYMPHRCTVAGTLAYITYTDAEGPDTRGKGGIMRLDLHTGKWTDVSPTQESYGEVLVSPADPDRLVACTMSLWQQQTWAEGSTTWGDQIYVSCDGGETWTNIMPRARYSEPTVTWLKASAQLHWCGSVKFCRASEGRAFFVSGNGIFVTDNIWDESPTFRMAVNGLEETVPLCIVSVEDAPLLTAIGDYDGFIYPTPTSRTARYSPPMGTTAGITVAGLDVERMARVGNKIYYTENGGKAWTELPAPVAHASYSHCALSADASILIVSPNGKAPYFTTDNGKTWAAMPDASSSVRIYPDYRKSGRFYAVHGDRFYCYTYHEDADAFTSEHIALSNAIGRIAVVSDRPGEVLVARGTDGISLVAVRDDGTLGAQTISMATATCIGVGRAAAGSDYPAIYIWGRPQSDMPTGLYRSDDKGQTWVRINDDKHQFGGPGNAQTVSGDMNVYGRVYMSTVGRGVVYGDLRTCGNQPPEQCEQTVAPADDYCRSPK